MGWAITIGLAALAFVALWRGARLSGPALELAGAALLIAIAGYAWQGSPMMPGKPVADRSARP